MKRKVSKLRLSPNEEARIIREEHERRRKLRIQQVREQQRYIALHIRQEVEQRRQQELQHLEEELRKDWEQQQQEKLQTVQTLYQESLQLLGQGHRSAKENEPDLAAIAQKEEENHIKAEERYREALKELKSQRLKDHERHTHISARKKALQAEKERSAKVARLPPPPPDPIQCIYPKKQHVKRSDVSAFAVSRYHMPENTVNRVEDTNQPNAHEEAELEVRRLRDLEMEETRRREEQLEKARVRGRQALRREQLVQDRERLLVELEHMQQTDLLRRRQQVSQMPPQIFQPLYKRQEVREDFQREMEFAFEDMYTGERRVKGDLVVRLVPEPLPAFSTGSQDQQLDITMEEIATSEMENTQDDSQRESGATEQETSAEAEPSRPPPRRALKKLLDRIRSQRDQWPDHSCRVPVADSPTTITDQIPERDTSIETGSLMSEEKDKQTPTDLGEPAHSPPALESAEPSPAADSLLPDVLSYKIQEFEEERKKREEKLEEEKRQQVFLLQELEEQKAKLEQMLLEDQQEREDLKAAVTQEIPVHQLEEPARDQEVTSVNVNAGEDDHTRRIRQYQQRLLDQNRIHQRSVEVARHRLAEYQRALQIRYNMAASSLPPVVVPPNVVQPPLQRPPPVQLPPPLRLPTTPVVPVNTQVEPQIAVNVTDTLASLSNVPGFTLSSKLPLHQVESVSSSTMNPRRAVTSWLTDSIMERVTQHLPERMRPSSVTKETPLHKACTTHHASSIPPQPDPVQAFSPSTTDRTPVPSGHAVVNKDTPPQEHLQTEYLSSTEATLERQRRELQEAKRRVSRQREALLLQQRLQEEERQRQEAEMEQIRRQKETLQAPIDTDEQPVQRRLGKS
ncbi:centrosomal protein of 295 kDa isoform X2 [Parambassis ranga]|uniref:Centrosomal protein of 295 kDa isoform X2 n=1 Tax=Parambassis ranga TaxID=210632 RepID=A0A6P7JI01_9TELE|nr:centrosomal protein of 295 kDa isoform X2 [Parambassis ranga]